MKKYQLLLLFCTSLLILGSLITLTYGPTPLNQVMNEAWLNLSGQLNKWNPLLDERLPRLIVLICTGASLAVSGAIMQSLFQNSLASPSILGISSGGCLAGILVFIFNMHFDYPYVLPFAAFFGCLLTLLLVYGLSKFQKGFQLNNLILTGIAISGLIFAFQSVLLYALRDNWQLIQTISEWEAGSTLDRNWQHVHMQLPLTVVGLLGCYLYRNEMNILALGEEEAINLGVDAQTVRWRLFLCIALLTGGALAAMGMVAFFGLVLPHIVRRAYGPDHNFLIPLCMIAGAAILIFLDLFIRIFSLHAFSIGNFSAIIGGIFFIFLLFKPQGRMAFQ